LLVIRRRQQRTQLRRILQSNLNHPRAVRIFIDAFRSRRQRSVHFRNGSGGWSVQVRYRFDRLYRSESFPRGDLRPDFRQLDKNDVPERILGIGGDANRRGIAFGFDPLVFLGVFVLGGIGHVALVLLGEPSWVNLRVPVVKFFSAAYKMEWAPPGP